MTALEALRAALRNKPGDTVLIVALEIETATVGGVQVAARQEFRLTAKEVFPQDYASPPSTNERDLRATDNLAIRAEADRQSSKLGAINAGETVRVSGSPVNGYLKLAARPGWVAADYLL